MSTIANLLVRIGIDDKDLAPGLRSAGEKIHSTGKSLTAGLTLPILGMGVAAFKASKDFNAGMANVATLIPGNAKRVDNLKRSVQDMAVKFGISTSDLSDGLYNVISAFGDTADTTAILEINAKAARAGLASTADAIALTSAVTKGYGDTSKAAVQKASDLALLTVRMGQTTFPELAASMGKVVPLAESMGQSQEELHAVFSTLTGVTGGAAEVATQYRGVLAGLMNPTKDLNELLNRQGFESGKAALEQLGLTGTMEMIAKASERTGKPITAYMASIESAPAILALAGASGKKYAADLEAMAGAAGTTGEAFREVTSGVNAQGFAWDQAKQKGLVFLQQVGDAMGPALSAAFDAAKPMVRVITDLSRRFAEASPRTQMLIVTLAGVVASVGPVMMVVGKMITLFAGLGKVVTAFRSVWLGLQILFAASPIGLVVVGLVALGAALVITYKKSETFRNIVNKAFGAVRDVVMGVVNWFRKAVPAAVDWVSKKWSAGWGKIKGTTTKLGNAIADFVKAIPRRLVGFFLNWTLPGLIIKHWGSIKAGTIRVAMSIVEWVRELPERFVNGLSSLGNKLLSAARTGFASLKTGASEKVTVLMEWVRELPERIANGLGNVGTLLYDQGKDLIQGLIDGIMSMVGRIGDAMGSIGSKIKGFLPGSPVKEGPLTSWNNGAAGKRLVELLATGLAATSPVEQAMNALAGRVAGGLPVPEVAGVGRVGSVGGGTAVGSGARVEVNFPATADPEAAYASAGGRIVAALSAAGV
jgi:TP901 family phage tail tape measure protein